tara:strand:+ start:4198 stop:4443 length:246 start_codon:yes stop_codon:yes gene_type:complete
MLIETEVQDQTLNANDRCDADCSAQAYVKVIGVTGELLFCSHHYNRAINDSYGYDRMQDFAYSVTDERDRLIENRLIGENV